jgi:hypothetical protein
MPFVCPPKRLNREELERAFRLKMGREMTPDERIWFRLAGLALDAKPEDGAIEKNLRTACQKESQNIIAATQPMAIAGNTE